MWVCKGNFDVCTLCTGAQVQQYRVASLQALGQRCMHSGIKISLPAQTTPCCRNDLHVRRLIAHSIDCRPELVTIRFPTAQC